MAISARRKRSDERRARGISARRAVNGAPGKPRNPAGSLSRLCQQPDPLPRVSGFLPRGAAASVDHLGKHDPFFIPPGAEAYKRDNPNAVVELLDTGHFALETHVGYIAQRIREVLSEI